MITSFRTSYKIGFSSSLSKESWSCNNELTKWNFDQNKTRKLHNAFRRGYEDGLRLRREVFAAGLVAAIKPGCDSTVQVLEF